MSTTADVDELYQLTGGLRRCVTSLVSRYGENPAMRRIVNDAQHILNGIERLDIDAEELKLAHALTEPNGAREMIQIPDTQYDTDFWRGVDDEGIGGQSGTSIPPSRKRG